MLKAQTLEKTAEVFQHDLKCAYCHTSVKPGDVVVFCPRDGVIHHAGCWSKNNHRCAVHGCEYTELITPLGTGQLSNSGWSQIQGWFGLLAFGLLGWLIALTLGLGLFLGNQPGINPFTWPTELKTVEVFANQGWQTTNVHLQAGDQVMVEYVSGAWTYAVKQFAPYNGNGPYEENYICAKVMSANSCLEAVPDFKKGALVGRIGQHLLGIGNHLAFTVVSGGLLELRMNDNDAGLDDNTGSISVRIIVKRL